MHLAEHARKGEAVTDLADTAEAVDLSDLGQQRANQRRQLDDTTAALRAGVLRALEEGRAEAEVARAAGIDRMTVRAWSGKR